MRRPGSTGSTIAPRRTLRSARWMGRAPGVQGVVRLSTAGHLTPVGFSAFGVPRAGEGAVEQGS